jgi:octaprenyl-diphosphate synthase
MSATDIIKKPIEEDLKKFEPYFASFMKSEVSLLNIITNYILKRKGKQIRPMFVFLSAKLQGEINNSTYNAASLIELMHTATLIHDDVVDNAYERRGFFSVNALWKNKIAVLVGDYLLSKGLLLAIHNNEFELLKIVSESVRKMSEGELLQIEKSRKLDISEEVYLKIINKKTATLFAACTASGVKSAGGDAIAVEKAKQFGELAGIAFQIKDDIFDYQKKNVIGKPAGNDIRERKMTLPLIYSLNKVPDSEKKEIIKILRTKKKNTKMVSDIIDFVHLNGGIDYATEVMNTYKNKSLEIVSEFADTPARDSMKELINYTISREL